MGLVVGHNCPGCGLDTPAVVCKECGATVVWDREAGTHCSGCGLSASTITCSECGLRADLDKRHGEHAGPTAEQQHGTDALDEGDDEDRRPRLGPALRRAVAIALAVGLHAALVVLLFGSDGGGAVALGHRFTRPAPGTHPW